MRRYINIVFILLFLCVWNGGIYARERSSDLYQQGMEAPYGPRTVRDYIYRPRFELFDLQNDPNERENLAADPKHAALLEEFKDKLRAFQKRTSDPWIMKWDYE